MYARGQCGRCYRCTRRAHGRLFHGLRLLPACTCHSVRRPACLSCCGGACPCTLCPCRCAFLVVYGRRSRRRGAVRGVGLGVCARARMRRCGLPPEWRPFWGKVCTGVPIVGSVSIWICGWLLRTPRTKRVVGAGPSGGRSAARPRAGQTLLQVEAPHDPHDRTRLVRHLLDLQRMRPQRNRHRGRIERAERASWGSKGRTRLKMAAYSTCLVKSMT